MAEGTEQVLTELTYTRAEIERSIKLLFQLNPTFYPMPDGTTMEVKPDIEQMFNGFWMLTDNMKAAEKLLKENEEKERQAAKI